MKIKILGLLALFVFCAGLASAGPLNYPKWEAMKKKKLIKELTREFSRSPLKEHPVSHAKIRALLADLSYNPPPPPSLKSEPRKEWKRPTLEDRKEFFRKRLLTEEAYSKGIEYLKKYEPILAAAEEKYGVPVEIIVSILWIETRYGKHTGGTNVLNGLYQMYMKNAFRGSPRMIRSYRLQIAYFLALCARKELNHKKVFGSWAGAMGIPQFMPYSYWMYGVDGDGDGNVDLFNSHADAIFSIANYLKEHGWEENSERALLRYNRDKAYTYTVLMYAAVLKIKR